MQLGSSLLHLNSRPVSGRRIRQNPPNDTGTAMNEQQDVREAQGADSTAPHQPGLLRGLLRALLVLVAMGLATAVLVLVAALQNEPSVSMREAITHQDVARALNLLRWHDPRRNRPGRPALARLDERDLEVLLGHAAQRWLNAATHVSVLRGGATVQLSAHLPANPFGRWLNVELHWAETGSLPTIDHCRVGRLPLPAGLAEGLLAWLAQRAGLADQLRMAGEVVHQVRFQPKQVLVRYAWRSDSTGRVLAALVPADGQQRLRDYSQRLTQLTEREKPAWDVPLPRLLQPMFQLARERTAAGGDAAAENRAALLVLTLFANGRSMDSIVAAAVQWPRPRHLRVLLGGREDLPLHFLVSAALAAEGSSPLSQAIGLYKEVTDSRGGSGFSFSDVAANRAGTRFGQNLVSDAAHMQVLLGLDLQDSDLLPALDDLPDFMPEAEFVRRFGGVGAPAYESQLAEIDRRLAALALLR